MWTCVAAALVLLGPATLSAVAGGFTLRADWFDRGNAAVDGVYADRYHCIYNGGTVPNRTEYDIEFPATGRYRVSALYAAADSRPVDLHLDGEKIYQGFGSVTGSWSTSSATWEAQCEVDITAGRHTIALVCPGPYFPHICALRFETDAPFPAEWRLARAVAEEKTEAEERGSAGQITPWSGGWFAEVAEDRLKKGESGGIFTGHLAAETRLVALLEEGCAVEITQHVREGVKGYDPNDELTWHLKPEDDKGPPRRQWFAVVVPKSDGTANRFVYPLYEDRLGEMSRRTIVLIDDFRTLPGTAADYLEAQRKAAETALAASEAQADTNATEKDAAYWRARFSEIHQAAARYVAVAKANPLVDFDRILLVRRNEGNLGLPQNWQSNCVLPRGGFNDRLVAMSLSDPGRSLDTVYEPRRPTFVGDVDLHFDANRLLFSGVGEDGKWNIFELSLEDGTTRQVTPSFPEADNYDACYLPDGAVIFSSTACYSSVPCVNGSTRVANLYRIEPDGQTIRRLCFDQEHNWCPTMLPNGRVLYQRWEYTDTPHAHARLMFHMNPDGTGQMEYYGSNSYWPNSMFYARPIPETPGMFAAIVTGHHGVPRMGELVVFDVREGRREADGALRRICHNQKEVVSPTDPKYESTLIVDNLVDQTWPKFLHPYPLSEKYFLTACQPLPDAPWGIYLADEFDNLVLLKELPGFALFEPLPLKQTPKPPIIPDKTDPESDEAVVYLADIYKGDGLRGVPRGTVKSLRLISYHYLYPNMGGPQGVVGMEGPWDIKRIIGTVPVRPDGSAAFKVPANTPIAVQPLDSEGKALQLMRSWFTAMPGEALSCVGCHESQNSSPPATYTASLTHRIDPIEPWYGPARGFSFAREVQPVLERYCVDCHDGKTETDGRTAFDLRGGTMISGYTSYFHYGAHDAGHFSTSYAELHRYVRRPGLESDYHLLMPMEYHANATQLMQLLSKGHYGVELDDEAMDRLVTWIDLNAPYHATWTEIAGAERVKPWADLRREYLKRFAGQDIDFEAVYPVSYRAEKPVGKAGETVAAEAAEALPAPGFPGWPFDAEEAKRRQAAQDGEYVRTVDLAEGVSLEVVRVPPGEFVMGSADPRFSDESPQAVVRIDRPFWMGRVEVSNAQFNAFDPEHDSRVESRFGMQFGVRGFYVNAPEQPVVRVSWEKAMAFCEWLSAKTGKRWSLPTEAQWEYACRAGTASGFSFGDESVDYSNHANLADQTLKDFTCHPYFKTLKKATPSKFDDWIPRDDRFNDGALLSVAGGQYAANPWGLYDMHGNVAEWTRTAYRPYPYHEDGRNDPSGEESRVVRGGSWRDRPRHARSAFRLAYRPYQGVYNVGFRVVCEE